MHIGCQYKYSTIAVCIYAKTKIMFTDLKKRVKDNFDKMSMSELFYVTIDRDAIWEQYLSGFPENERQEHNCNCCKSFIRQYGGIVAIINGTKVSMWDEVEVDGYTDAIANLSEYVKSLPITDVFINGFTKCGTDKNPDKVRNVIWQHFYIELPSKFVVREDSIDATKGDKRSNKDVLARGLAEISIETTESVLELIEENSIYRGKEFEAILKQFLSLQKEYKKASDKDLFTWSKSVTSSSALCRLRNASIGTLLVNLSEGMDIELAVGKFEQMVAPTNYKRPTSLVTPKMVEQAQEKLKELGLEHSMERRFANQTDLNTEDVIYVDKSSNVSDVFADITKDTIVNPRNFSKTEEISINDFIEKIVPNSEEIEVLLENRHLPNMVSLITGVDKEVKSLFKWDNLFSWSYTGGITDTIKERVKQAGGNVEGVLRVSLSWFNFDDLDLHVIEPNGTRIYYGDKRSITSGQLDVDMNAGSGTTREAVENIVWTDQNRMREGNYQVIVNNYSKRENVNFGYDVQIEYGGEIFDLSSLKSPSNSQSDVVAMFNYSKEKGIVFTSNVNSTVTSKEKWGLKTNKFHKVKNIMLSPNYWEKQIGNKHFMFFLENAINDESTRPFFNEFLKDDFTENRKVFEILGSKIKVEATINQLSGIGFSETNRNNIIVRVKGKLTRTFKIVI